MTATPHDAVTWVYRGTWGILARWFRVPTEPPTIPFHDAAAVESFRPSTAYLRYLKFQFWLFFLFLAAVAGFAWVVALMASPLIGILLAPPILVAVLTPALVSYLAIHLRFDTTWYVLTDRSLRIRRGIWTIHETTITFENIQNVTVNQGPLQRIYGSSSVLVQTAGGSARKGPHGEEIMGQHAGLMEGLADAPRIRDLIMARLTKSRTAGLGDEPPHAEMSRGWSAQHIALLREIRDRARDLA
jgi:membrane protein YdbS with pleckstrin-like domain